MKTKKPKIQQINRESGYVATYVSIPKDVVEELGLVKGQEMKFEVKRDNGEKYIKISSS